tara:strand:+ start:895 stop:1572 length:678 start_codon:yes stop_codon:yes gene_type:complete
MKMYVSGAALVLASGVAFGQSTVSFESMGWTDLGTSDVIGVVGNFLPGWTSIAATPDLGSSLFSASNVTLTGDPDDAAIWLNQFEAGSPQAGANEIVELSLDGFAVGQTYELSFYATILTYTSNGWAGNMDSIDVGIDGADVSDWDSEILSSAVGQGNTWDLQSLVFTAQSDTVSFAFGEGADGPQLGGFATRFGMDGFAVRVIPAPSGLAMLGLGGLAMGRRRR